jgi:hypothetical protein
MPEILDQRREIVEHPFGSIKQWMNQGACSWPKSFSIASTMSPAA